MEDIVGLSKSIFAVKVQFHFYKSNRAADRLVKFCFDQDVCFYNIIRVMSSKISAVHGLSQSVNLLQLGDHGQCFCIELNAYEFMVKWARSTKDYERDEG